jgi:hypothetical protein
MLRVRERDGVRIISKGREEASIALNSFVVGKVALLLVEINVSAAGADRTDSCFQLAALARNKLFFLYAPVGLLIHGLKVFPLTARQET